MFAPPFKNLVSFGLHDGVESALASPDRRKLDGQFPRPDRSDTIARTGFWHVFPDGMAAFFKYFSPILT